MAENKIKCSIGVFAFNEEKNIEFLLDSLFKQSLKNVEIDEILVMADGSTDKTKPIASKFPVRVLWSEKRKGKSAAINDFIKNAKNNILIIESGDTIPDKNAVEEIVSPFNNSKVGMVGARPKPVDSRKGFMGYLTNLIWDLHHIISLKTPKMGEMVAFRRVFNEIPLTSVDEACIEFLMKKQGYKIVYAPEAIVYNKGAGNLRDFLRQRRRIFCGHLRLKKEGYRVSTDSVFKTLSLIKSTKFSFFLPLAMLVEAFARLLGYFDYIIGRDHIVWEIAETTKNLK